MPDLPVPSKSPLAEADPESLRLLMSMDPLSMTNENLDQLVEIFRAQRGKWLVEDKIKQTKPKGTKSTVAKIAAPTDLSLKDLGL